MKIQVGFDHDVFGTIEEGPDGQLEVDPVNPADGELLGGIVDWYGESLAFEGVPLEAITPRLILETILDRRQSRNWAKVIEP